jgi:hypothetical protein
VPLIGHRAHVAAISSVHPNDLGITPELEAGLDEINRSLRRKIGTQRARDLVKRGAFVRDERAFELGPAPAIRPSGGR